MILDLMIIDSDLIILRFVIFDVIFYPSKKKSLGLLKNNEVLQEKRLVPAIFFLAVVFKKRRNYLY
jgi:hypothetical protein